MPKTFTCPAHGCSGWTLERCLKRQTMIRSRSFNKHYTADITMDHRCLRCGIGPWAAAKMGKALPRHENRIRVRCVPEDLL